MEAQVKTGMRLFLLLAVGPSRWEWRRRQLLSLYDDDVERIVRVAGDHESRTE